MSEIVFTHPRTQEKRRVRWKENRPPTQDEIDEMETAAFPDLRAVAPAKPKAQAAAATIAMPRVDPRTLRPYTPRVEAQSETDRQMYESRRPAPKPKANVRPARMPRNAKDILPALGNNIVSSAEGAAQIVTNPFGAAQEGINSVIALKRQNDRLARIFAAYQKANAAKDGVEKRRLLRAYTASGGDPKTLTSGDPLTGFKKDTQALRELPGFMAEQAFTDPIGTALDVGLGGLVFKGAKAVGRAATRKPAPRPPAPRPVEPLVPPPPPQRRVVPKPLSRAQVEAELMRRQQRPVPEAPEPLTVAEPDLSQDLVEVSAPSTSIGDITAAPVAERSLDDILNADLFDDLDDAPTPPPAPTASPVAALRGKYEATPIRTETDPVWMLPDGKVVSAGRSHTESAGDSMRSAGIQTQNPNESLQGVMNDGAIRVNRSYGRLTVDIAEGYQPTPEQVSAISRMASDAKKSGIPFDYSFSDYTTGKLKDKGRLVQDATVSQFGEEVWRRQQAKNAQTGNAVTRRRDAGMEPGSVSPASTAVEGQPPVGVPGDGRRVETETPLALPERTGTVGASVPEPNQARTPDAITAPLQAVPEPGIPGRVPPPEVETGAATPEIPVQGLKMRDVEEISTRNNFALPARESMREGWEAVKARAERDYGEIVPSLKDYDKEKNPSITRDEAYVGLVRLRELTDTEIPRQIDEAAKHPEGSPERAAAEQRLNELSAEGNRLSDMLFRSGSESGRRLQFQKIYAVGPFDAPTILKKAQAATRGGLSGDAQRSLIKLAERGKTVEAEIGKRIEREGEAAAKRLEAGENATPKKKPSGTTKPQAFGANNKIFTSERAEAARQRIRAKTAQLNVGIDPTLFRDVVELGGFYLEAGLRHKPTWKSTMQTEVPGIDDASLENAWQTANRAVRLRASAEKTLLTINDKKGVKPSPDAIVLGESEYAKGARDLKAFAARIRQRFGDKLDEATLNDLFQKSAEKYRQDHSQLNQIRREMAGIVGEEAYKQRTTLEKAVYTLRDLAQAPTSLAASFDYSGVLRQGGVLVAANPGRASTSLVPMFQASMKGGAKVADQWAAQIRARSNWDYYERAGLDITDYDASVDLSKAEETFRSKIAQKVPWVRASDRAYVTFLNKLRADTMDAFLDDLKTMNGGREPTDGELKILGNAINVLSGRGNLYGANRAAGTLSAFFFSPRFVMSRLQTLSLQPVWYGSMIDEVGRKGTGNARKVVAKTYARAIRTTGLVMGLVALAKAMGANIETEQDPRSSDFAKIRVGKTRFDPWGGMQQFVVLGSRLWTGETKGVAPDGNVTDLTEGKYGKPTRLTTVLKFTRSKLAPVPGALWTTLDANTTFSGEKTTPGAIAEGFVTPMSFRDMYSALREEGWGHAAAVAFTNTFGISGSTYGDDQEEHTIIGDALAALRR